MPNMKCAHLRCLMKNIWWPTKNILWLSKNRYVSGAGTHDDFVIINLVQREMCLGILVSML